MSELDLEPLVRGDADPLEKTVLGSARADAPSHAAKAALLAALAPAPPRPSDAPQHVAPSLLRRFGARYAPGVVLVVGAGAAALMSVSGDVDRHTEPNAGVVEVVPTVAAPSIPEPTVAPTAIVEPSAPEPHEHAETAPVKPPARHAPLAPRAVARPSAEPEEDSTLAREIARVGAARSALAAGDPARTLTLLDAYEADFPKGAFTVEVSVLRVEALARSGQVEEARKLGDRFLAQHPDGAFARRVTATLQGIAPSTKLPLTSPRD